MTKFFTLFFLIFSGVSYSQQTQQQEVTQYNTHEIISNNNTSEVTHQKDSITLNTPAIFSIKFYQKKKSLLGLNGNTYYNNVFIDYMTDEYIMIRQKHFDDKTNPNDVTQIRRVYLKDIQELGYKTETTETFSSLVGMGVGFLGGAIIGIVAHGFDKAEKRSEIRFI